MVVLSFSLTLLLVSFTALEMNKQQTVLETARSSETLDRIKSLIPVFETLNPDQAATVLTLTSTCHRGHSLTPTPYPFLQTSTQTDPLAARLSQALSLDSNQVMVGHVSVTQADFSYAKCKHDEMQFPLDILVISIGLSSGQWFNVEIHPHEWHVQDIIYWLKWSGIAFFVIGTTAIFFIRHLNKPLESLSHASEEFAQGLKISTIEECGPPDIRKTIKSFNDMQQQVTDEITRRTQTLAAISHDIRTPLTALRIKAELIDDEPNRTSLIASINKMEKITASALEFLKGENRTEPMRTVDLSALLESECLDFAELGQPVTYSGPHNVRQRCRPEALARAVRNLVENAVKYGGDTIVDLSVTLDMVTISVSDHGPGIPLENIKLVVEPFKRLSQARESDKGGFGLGLAVAKAIAEGHDSQLSLEPNQPTGLVATIRLKRRA